MSCNCKTNKKILELANKYGRTKRESRKDILKSHFHHLGYACLELILAALLIVPMGLYVLYRGIFTKERGIHLNKLIMKTR